MISLPQLAITATLQKSSDAPMNEETILRVTLPIKIAIGELKKAKATAAQVFEMLEFFTLSYGAAIDAIDKTKEDSSALLEERARKVHLSTTTANNVLSRMKTGGPQTCTGLEIKALDEGFTAAVELHDVLPEWAFMQAGYQLIKYGVNRNKSKRKTKRKKRR